MQIVLVRHGRPKADNNKILSAGGFANWVKNYNHSLVRNDSRPAIDLLAQFSEHYMVSSDLPRAIHSANIALQQAPQSTHKSLREMDIPRYKLGLNLRAWTWVYVNRALWMMGLKGRFETYKMAKQRALNNAEMLVSMAHKQGKVLVFGHGFMHLHVRRNLTELGWQIEQKDNAYWGVSVLTKLK